MKAQTPASAPALAAHTAGPWYIGRRTGQSYIYGPFGEEVAGPSTFTSGNDETLANARLIASAPALLSALVGMMNRYGDKSAHPTCDASISARAAIARAQVGAA